MRYKCLIIGLFRVNVIVKNSNKTIGLISKNRNSIYTQTKKVIVVLRCQGHYYLKMANQKIECIQVYTTKLFFLFSLLLFQRWKLPHCEIEYSLTHRLNVIRIILNKSWKLNARAHTNTYKALIFSVLDYNAQIAPCLSEQHMKSLQAIQTRPYASFTRNHTTVTQTSFAS